MQKIIITIITIFFGYNLLFAQDEQEMQRFKVGLTGGLSVYFVSELKDINTQVINASPFNLQTVNNFPPTIFYGGFILNRMGKRIYFGPSYSFYTTGSRLGIKDYSGSYRFDQILSAHSPGGQFEILLFTKNKINIYFEPTAGAHFATWKMDELLKVGDEKVSDEQKLKAVKPFIYPAFKIAVPVYSHLQVALKAGYSFDLAGKYKTGNMKSDIKAPFSGPRISVVLEDGFF
ncbi:MAG TPA: hypothetical protein ENN90_10925 [Mariniphaga anaerophila]|uniref:Outer membrane protein beta-barrel domain-containing protein n=1 Tax=Mariniphaga anaerophila TaxID=1484053 RepID=A0A831LX25_9BACT|nr:hypothetical protein [Mariniphaga anaerophila]